MKVLVVDRQPIVRVGIRTVLEAEEGITIVGEVDNAQDALTTVRRSNPDVVILDLDIRGERNGLDLCREIKSVSHPPGVIIYTALASEEAVFSSRLHGADSFVNKSEDPARLLEAVREPASGKRVWFLGEIDENPGPTHNITAEHSLLTPREREVFALLVRRLTNAEIAQELSISHQTTKNHVSSILRKLGAKNRMEVLAGTRSTAAHPNPVSHRL